MLSQAQKLVQSFYGDQPATAHNGDYRGPLYGPRVTATKNIGRNLLKTAKSKYTPHQGARECARRRRQAGAQ